MNPPITPDFSTPNCHSAVRAALDAIDDILVGLNFVNRGDVIDVLTALRGPDDMNLDAKACMTNFIRQGALPKTCHTEYLIDPTSRWSLRTKGDSVTIPQAHQSHFESHIRGAIRALGWMK